MKTFNFKIVNFTHRCHIRNIMFVVVDILGNVSVSWRTFLTDKKNMSYPVAPTQQRHEIFPN